MEPLNEKRFYERGLMGDTTELRSIKTIRDRVYMLRGEQVMIDSDLADIYGYELKAMNQQVKRNLERFPEDFMFQLTRDEVELVKSQIVTSQEKQEDNLKSQFVTSSWGGKRKLPYAFTEQGIYMLATVLKGELAEQQSIRKTYEENVSWAEPTSVSQTIHFSNNPETGLMGMTVGGNQPIAVDKAAEDRLGLQKIVNAQKKQNRQKQLLVRSARKR